LPVIRHAPVAISPLVLKTLALTPLSFELLFATLSGRGEEVREGGLSFLRQLALTLLSLGLLARLLTILVGRTEKTQQSDVAVVGCERLLLTFRFQPFALALGLHAFLL